MARTLLVALAFCVASPSAGPSAPEGEAPEMTIGEEGLELGNALVIEGKVEKPQVQFPLLRESPPLREIRFEMSFLGNILRLDRENVPDAKPAEEKP